MPMACVLVSDVIGSTALFERMGNAHALRRIDSVLERMRTIIVASGGHCVKSKGDDVLSFFPQADQAFDAAWSMIGERWADGLSVHLGGYSGEILNHADDIYGNAVNTAARLASLAKAGEILFGDACFTALAARNRARFLAIGAIPLRGKDHPTQVFSCAMQTLGTQTTVMPGLSAAANRTAIADLTLGKAHWQLGPGGRVTLGRAPDNDVVINLPSVSRSHGALAISHGALEYSDHSSGGSILRLENGQDLTVHRRTTLLTGSGDIVIGAVPDADRRNVLEFRTVVLERRDRTARVLEADGGE